jgi:four helix bundle suffix protein
VKHFSGKIICFGESQMDNREPLIPKHGGFRNLISFQVSQLVYDVTVRFCRKYIDKYSRTNDQMVQAARSGVQNIAEGSQASGTSKKTELKLTSVARASLEELRLDYEDFLRHRGLNLWERTDPRRQELIDKRCKTADEVARWVKDVFDRENGGLSGRGGLGGPMSGQNISHRRAPSHHRNNLPPMSTQSTTSTPSTLPEIAANGALVLITVACSLLDRQLASQSNAFENEGGFTERLYRVRTTKRRGNL